MVSKNIFELKISILCNSRKKSDNLKVTQPNSATIDNTDSQYTTGSMYYVQTIWFIWQSIRFS